MIKLNNINGYKIWGEIPILWVIPLLVCSYFSVGYHHTDEHFQILEYANYKMGLSPAGDLPWEFHEKMRPTLQPWLAVALWKMYGFFFAFNPYVFAFLLRLLSGLFSIVVFRLLRTVLLPDADDFQRKIYYFGAFLLWFMPFVEVRFSSETWSALTFGTALYFALKNSRNKLCFPLSGLLFAASFWFRFQVAFMIAGFGLWQLVFNRQNFANLLLIGVGVFIGGALCFQLDSAFYGAVVWTPYQYYYANVVLKIAEKFGTYGVWYYPAMYALHLIPPISFFVLFLVGKFIFKQPKNMISWLIIAFLIPHFWLAHKEVRFLYPLFIFVPYILAFYAQNMLQWRQKFPFVFKSILVLNYVLLALIIFKPADIDIFNYKQLTLNGQKPNSIYLNNTYNELKFVHKPPNFYQSFTQNKHIATFDIDTSKVDVVHSPFLIQDNRFRYIFLSKMGDDLERYGVHQAK